MIHIRQAASRTKRPLIFASVTSIGISAYALEQHTATTPASEALPRQYDADAIASYWSKRPLSVFGRVIDILSESVPIAFRVAMDWDDALGQDEELQRRHAMDVKGALTRLGPAFVKAGQQISIRPDLVSPAVLKVLQTLCDAVEPVQNDVAMKILRDELVKDKFSDLDEIFVGGEDGLELVASASLGQVYKGKIKVGENEDQVAEVAIKVQRPDMVSRVSLDLFLLYNYAQFLDMFTSTFTKQSPYHVDLIKNFAAGSYTELDYEREAFNQIRFKDELNDRKCLCVVPAVYQRFTTARVITTEWINGVKLVDAPNHQIQALIPVGVELFLTQLLDIGAFHADPHPGNLLVTENNELCLLDFGLIAEVDEKSQHAMTAAIVHLISGDFETLVSRDAKLLGFLPDDYDTQDLQPILTKVLTEGLLNSGSNLRTRKRKLMEISNELNEIFFKYPFSVPPFFALVTRGLGLLEGIALAGDPNFDIFKASYPYARRRAMKLFGMNILRAGSGTNKSIS